VDSDDLIPTFDDHEDEDIDGVELLDSDDIFNLPQSETTEEYFQATISDVKIKAIMKSAR
jgi:hypothetical protein